MNWESIYELWLEHRYFGNGDDEWVILCRKTAKRVQIYGYKTEELAKQGAKELFDRIEQELENNLLG